MASGFESLTSGCRSFKNGLHLGNTVEVNRSKWVASGRATEVKVLIATSSDQAFQLTANHMTARKLLDASTSAVSILRLRRPEDVD